MYKYSISFVLLLLLAGGCGKTTEEDSAPRDLTRVSSGDDYIFVNSQNEPVLLVAGEEISPEDIIDTAASIGDLFIVPGEEFGPIAQSMEKDEFKERLQDPMLIIVADAISDILLYKSAQKEYGDNFDELIEKSVEGEISKRIQQFGGDQVKADEVIKENWHDKETYRKLIKREILKQWYLSMQKVDTGFITYRQLIRKYNRMKDENFAITPEIQFSSIDIIPSRLKLPDPNMDRNEYADNLANELYSRLQSGEDFGELAKEYSQGHRKDYGGLWEPINPDSLADPFDVIANAAMDMNPGEISKPIKNKSYIFIVKLEKKISAGYIPFEQVQVQVKNALVEELNNEQAIDRLNESINKQMESFETKAFINYCLEKIYNESNPG